MDNLTELSVNIDQAVDPNALPGGILAVEHNAVMKAIVNSLGKYVGFPFLAKREGQVLEGCLIWNGNNFNTQTIFLLTVNRLTQDGNDFGKILQSMSNGDLFHIKDFQGRSSLLQFIEFQPSVDAFSNEVYNINVQGFADNPDYIYTEVEESQCLIEIIKQPSLLTIFTINKPLVIKSPLNNNADVIEIGDIVQTYIGDKLIKGVYNGGSLGDINNYRILDTTTIN